MVLFTRFIGSNACVLLLAEREQGKQREKRGRAYFTVFAIQKEKDKREEGVEIVKFFKNQSSTVKVKEPKEKQVYIFQTAVSHSGIVGLGEDCGIDYRGREYVFFELTFLQPIGIDRRSDLEIYESLEDFVNSLEFEFEVGHPLGKQRLLDSNIAFFENRLEEMRKEGATSLQCLALENRIHVMRVLNNRNHLRRVAKVQKQFENDFVKAAELVFLVRKFSREEIENYVGRLNNEY